MRPADGDEGMMAAIARMAEAAGLPSTRLMADFAALAVGPGRIDFSDFERLRLYDDAFWGGHDRRRLVGQRRAHELALAVNFRHDCFALATDRLAACAYLGAHGLPTEPVLAIYRPGLATPGPNLIRTRGDLRAFLETGAGEPMVAQPVEGGGRRCLFGAGADPATDIDRLLDEVRDTGEVSWLLRPLLAPHPDAAPDGQRLAPVRLLTVQGGSGPLVLRACWRLGGRDDIVACLDLETGAVIGIVPAAAPHRARAAPPGFSIPDWPRMKATAVEAARLMGQFGLLGWDIAATSEGPVILDIDPTPDLELHQLVDRQGLMDSWFQDFVGSRRRLAAEHRRLV
ncbi:MAG TPA: sugar-transfer associated ATP-grasp domain-containing protein [Caulobacteraceae bacterium]|nr:sugar-transfer associated ATP-grasp domain-containing protein [Caulobacteraceae bacterium]